MEKNLLRARWFVIIAFAVACLATLNYNGAFFDEAIYITAGLRTFEGHGLADRYMTWFAGSLAWPILAGAGYTLGGILGTRVVAAALGTLTLAAVGRAATNLFHERVGFWTTLAFALNGPFFALSRLGAYDILSLSAIAVSFWAVTELAHQGDRTWLLVAAGAYPLAVFAKYPIGLMILPLLATLVLLRNERAKVDVGMLIFIGGAIGLAIYLPLREQISVFFDWRLQNRPGFGVPLSTIAFAIVYLSTLPALLAVAGWVQAKRRRALATVLLATMGIWPIYHIVFQDPVGTNKHLVFGYLFAYPLVGLTLSTLWSAERAAIIKRVAVGGIVVVLAIAGVVQVNQANHSWPNLTFATRFLTERVQPGDKLLINESWPFTLGLYDQGRIYSPWDVYDTYRVTNEATAPDICEFEWVVDVKGSYSWPPEVAAALDACESYQRVYSHASRVINLGADFNYVSYPVETVIWQQQPEAQ